MKPKRLDQDEADLLFDLTLRLTGMSRGQELRADSLIANLYRRMEALNCPDLMAYLQIVGDSEEELSHLISLITIHTTSWFREMPHYTRMESDLLRIGRSPKRRVFRMLSAACSTGEELYSFAFILETNRLRNPEFEYQLIGVDVDPISVKKASEGVYKMPKLSEIPMAYRKFIKALPAKGADIVQVDQAIRSRVTFAVGNLLSADDLRYELFDQVVCRNVLIYMNPAQIDKIILHLLQVLQPEGTLTIGHCETIDGRALNLVSLGNSSYRRPLDVETSSAAQGVTGRLMVVDKSDKFLKWFTPPAVRQGYSVIPARSAAEATQLLSAEKPDLILLDPDLPDEDGFKWLEGQFKLGSRTPVILLSEVGIVGASRFLEALSRTADDYINKARLATSHEIMDRIDALIQANRARQEISRDKKSVAKLRRAKPELFRPALILLGASTGGTEALNRILREMPADSPPVVCVQHIPVEFALPFLERVSRSSGLKIGVQQRETELLGGHVYMSTGGLHVGIRQRGDTLQTYYSSESKISGHRPSVDFLFQSASLLTGLPIIAALLSGMGRDGAQGLLDLRHAGALCLAQDEASSAVWGMPGAAVRLDAVDYLGNIPELNSLLLEAVNLAPRRLRKA